MSDAKCSCERFERLEGASVAAYAAAFLEDLGRERDVSKKNLYRCRVCGRVWERRAPVGEGKRPSLVRREGVKGD
ncbi:MAG TPA: hypothetical protein VFX96_17000 [Pyrinomonadaceae bacterium]|nr:hypothetical protein [Pyrinomonadaceae bacterium]